MFSCLESYLHVPIHFIRDYLRYTVVTLSLEMLHRKLRENKKLTCTTDIMGGTFKEGGGGVLLQNCRCEFHIQN